MSNFEQTITATTPRLQLPGGFRAWSRRRDVEHSECRVRLLSLGRWARNPSRAPSAAIPILLWSSSNGAVVNLMKRRPLIRPWTREDDATLLALHRQGRQLTSIAARLRRSTSAVNNR